MRRADEALKSYPEADARRWLGWLANGMWTQGETVLLIERLQPSWLTSEESQKAYLRRSRVWFWLLASLAVVVPATAVTIYQMIRAAEAGEQFLVLPIPIFLPVVSYYFGRSNADNLWRNRGLYGSADLWELQLSWRAYLGCGGAAAAAALWFIIVVLLTNRTLLDGSTIAAVLGLAAAAWMVAYGLTIAPHRKRGPEPPARPSNVKKPDLSVPFAWAVVSALVALPVVLMIRGSLTLGDVLDASTWGILGIWGAIGLLAAVAVGQASKAAPRRRNLGNEIVVAETLRWSARRSFGRLIRVWVAILAASGALGLADALSKGWPSTSLDVGYLARSAGVLILVALVLLAPPAGLVAGRKLRSDRPGQGLWLAVRNAFLVGIAIFIVVTAGFWVLLETVLGGGAWWGAPLVGFVEGFVVFLFYGGVDPVRHRALLRTAVREDHLPKDLSAFLDYAVDRLGLMRRVGGGYMFIHRHVLEHFAKEFRRNVEASGGKIARPLGTPWIVDEAVVEAEAAA